MYTNKTLPPLSDLYLANFNASCHQDARRPQDVRRPKNVRRPEMTCHTTRAVPGTTTVRRTPQRPAGWRYISNLATRPVGWRYKSNPTPKPMCLWSR